MEKVSRISRLIGICLFLIVFVSASYCNDVQPNVLLIVSEDNGPELGCYGTPDIKTPSLDRLAEQGCRFENAYVPHAVCSASRAAFLTGLYPFQNGQIGLATHQYSMYRSWDNIPSLLKKHGYRTGLMGKLHVNPESAFPFDFRWNESKSNSFNSRNVQRVAKVAGDFFRSSKQPFFLSLNFADAHFPILKQQNGLPQHPLSGKDITSPLPFIGVDSPRLRQGTADYYNCLMRLDTGIGMVLDELRRAKLSENTLVIYIGDHGAQFSRGKGTCYEGGLRIPMIIRWPTKVKPQTVRKELVSTIDILPTILEAAGLPKHPFRPGHSLLPLTRSSDTLWRKHLFAERTAYSASTFFPQRTVRDQRYKLILNLLPERTNAVAKNYESQNGAFFKYGTTKSEIDSAPKQIRHAYDSWHRPPPIELYDLKNDPWEFDNLAAKKEHNKKKVELLNVLLKFRQQQKDPLLDRNLLLKLAKEHETVVALPKGRYPKGTTWNYVSYLGEFRAQLAPIFHDLSAEDISFVKEKEIVDLKSDYVSYFPQENVDEISVGPLEKDKIVDLKKFAEEISLGTHGKIDSLLIAKDGKLMFESYFRKGRINYPHFQMSITKSYTSLAIGRAIELGHLAMADLNKPVLDFLDQIDSSKIVEGADSITLHEAMNMRSGIRLSKEATIELRRPNSKWKGQKQIQAYLERSRPITANSKTFKYQGCDTALVMQVLEKVVPGSAKNFIHKELLSPLGISSYGWQADVSGFPKAAAGSSMTSRNMLKFGLLVRNQGTWKGKKLVSNQFIDRATDKIHTNPQGTSYGYFWWRHQAKVGNRMVECKSARGAGGQYIMIFDELDLIVVVTAHNKGMGKMLATIPERVARLFVND